MMFYGYLIVIRAVVNAKYNSAIEYHFFYFFPPQSEILNFLISYNHGT
jgi:hypothetical protein